jgi:hypothetical protein
MRGKHPNLLKHGLATLRRELLRHQIDSAVQWEPLRDAEPGCTALIGVCSKLSDILLANLRCLWKAPWPQLKRVILVVDTTRPNFPIQIEHDVRSRFHDIEADFHYYSEQQSATAESAKLPYVYSWLSWCIALQNVRTAHVLFHDYDALILDRTLRQRYELFSRSVAKVQGIGWYEGNGIETEDHLATTFEAFMDARWLRSFRPIDLFNKMRLIEGRSIDFDTTLDLQHRTLRREERAAVPMQMSELVHPSQMIHQYTMFQRSPGARLPCFSIPMIPFYRYLAGRPEALEYAVQAVANGERENLDLLGDGSRFNFSQLTIANVDWILKQIVQACVALCIPSDCRIYAYGRALYSIINTASEQVWKGDFTEQQRTWIRVSAKRSLTT